MRLRLRDFLAQLGADTRPPIPGTGIAIVVAHPDDETVGCGATLLRLRGARVVVITDGAPRNLLDARNNGFDDADTYAEARRRELRAALSLAGVAHKDTVLFSVPDQQAAGGLLQMSQQLAILFSQWGVSIALTHSYEGGHPDHDATAFAVHQARSLCRRLGQAVEIIEMPYYRADGMGEAKQSFACSEGEIAIRLTGEETARKREMLACYATQRRTLAGFAIDVERFRPAPDYDFAELPNGGRLLYEAHDWNMSAGRWQDLVATARVGLDEDGGSWP